MSETATAEANGAQALGEPPWRLRLDAKERLVLIDAAGREHVGVYPVRAFPLSMPRQGISLCDPDGKEVVWIDNLDHLVESARKLVEDSLARREFVPIILQVVAVSAAVEPSEWEVITDRGPTTFLLKGEDDVHRLDENRALVTDAHGIRYLIPDTQTLDSTSRRLLERFL